MSRPSDSGYGNPIITMFLFRFFFRSNQTSQPEPRRALPYSHQPYQRRRVREYRGAVRPQRERHHFSTTHSHYKADGRSRILGTEQKESEDAQKHAGVQAQIHNIACVADADSRERSCSTHNVKKCFTSDSQIFKEHLMPYLRPLSTIHPAFRHWPTKGINKHQDDENTTQRCEESSPPPLPPRPLVWSTPPMASKPSFGENEEQSPGSADDTTIIASTDGSLTAIDPSEDVRIYYDNSLRPQSPNILRALSVELWARRAPDFDWEPHERTCSHARRAFSRLKDGKRTWITGERRSTIVGFAFNLEHSTRHSPRCTDSLAVLRHRIDASLGIHIPILLHNA